MKRSFDTWLDTTDRLCEEQYGLSIHDLPDLDHYAMWEGGVTPAQAVQRTIRYAEGD